MLANQTMQPSSRSVVNGQDHGRVEGIQVNAEASLAVDNQISHGENGKILTRLINIVS